MGKKKLVVTSFDEAIAELVSQSDHRILAIWASDCAERVLSYFEEIYPEDDRPRQAIETGRAWVRNEVKMAEARKAAFAAHAAARNAHQFPAACSAARATGHAAATAHVAAIYAITAIRDAHDLIDDDSAISREREWQQQHLINLSEN